MTISGGDFTLSGGLYFAGAHDVILAWRVGQHRHVEHFGQRRSLQVKDGNFIIGDRDASGGWAR